MGEDLDADPSVDEGEISIDLGSGDGVAISVDPANADLQTHATHIHPDAPGWPGNKFRQRWFFRFVAPGAGDLSLDVTALELVGGSGTGRVRITTLDAIGTSSTAVSTSVTGLALGEIVYFSVQTRDGPTRFEITPTFSGTTKVNN